MSAFIVMQMMVVGYLCYFCLDERVNISTVTFCKHIVKKWNILPNDIDSCGIYIVYELE